MDIWREFHTDHLDRNVIHVPGLYRVGAASNKAMVADTAGIIGETRDLKTESYCIIRTESVPGGAAHRQTLYGLIRKGS